jgi:hypothetical protein
MTTKFQVIDPSTINVSQLNSVEFAQKLKLPTIQAAYLALAPDNTVLYIGASKNLRTRWSGQSHLKFQELKHLGCNRIAYIPVIDKELLFKTEAVLIKFFCPQLNDRHLNPNSINQDGLSKVLAEDSIKGVQRVIFNFKVDPDVIDWFTAHAESSGKSRPVLARLALTQYLEKYQPQEKQEEPD